MADRHAVLGTPMQPPFPDGFEQLVVGMGCFWGAERVFWQAEGVYTTAVGYAGGYTPNPTYEEVCSGSTGHAEVVLVVFDPAKTSYEQMLALFWENHNPTQGMRQGNDRGTQYRSAIYWDTERHHELARPHATPTTNCCRPGLPGDHHRDRRGGSVLLRRGLPPAVPGQEPAGLLRPRRHRRQLPRRPRHSRPGRDRRPGDGRSGLDPNRVAARPSAGRRKVAIFQVDPPVRTQWAAGGPAVSVVVAVLPVTRTVSSRT